MAQYVEGATFVRSVTRLSASTVSTRSDPPGDAAHTGTRLPRPGCGWPRPRLKRRSSRRPGHRRGSPPPGLAGPAGACRPGRRVTVRRCLGRSRLAGARSGSRGRGRCGRCGGRRRGRRPRSAGWVRRRGRRGCWQCTAVGLPGSRWWCRCRLLAPGQARRPTRGRFGMRRSMPLLSGWVAGGPAHLDDQAEQVLGLLRGSGSRSRPVCRPGADGTPGPSLGLRRVETRSACRERV